MSAERIFGEDIMDTMPPEAQFGLYINFDKSQPRPQRIFQAADQMITAFGDFDRMLAKSIDSKIEPVLLLEDIDAGSLLVWLRNILKGIDDGALKEFDVKQQIGKYFVKGKYLAIDFLNRQIYADDKKRIEQLRYDLYRLAQETDVRHLPGYAPVPVPQLITVLSEMSQAREQLAQSDEMKYVSDQGEEAIRLDISWSSEEIEDLYVKESISHGPAEMILLVKRPDYIGNTQWEFKHGRSQSFLAKIADEEWLRAFQERKIDVRPGDALRCLVSHQIKYGYDNEVVGERFVVERVIEVLEKRSAQLPLLGPDSENRH